MRKVSPSYLVRSLSAHSGEGSFAEAVSNTCAINERCAITTAISSYTSKRIAEASWLRNFANTSHTNPSTKMRHRRRSLILLSASCRRSCSSCECSLRKIPMTRSHLERRLMAADYYEGKDVAAPCTSVLMSLFVKHDGILIQEQETEHVQSEIVRDTVHTMKSLQCRD